MPERIYEWFSALAGRAEPVNAAELRSMWTEDCVIVANGQVKCTGIAALGRHFEEVRAKLRSWKVHLPFPIRVAQNDCVAVRYRVDFVPIHGSPSRALVNAFFDLHQGKATRITEVVHFEGAQLHLENH
jgi:hypothetical protein